MNRPAKAEAGSIDGPQAESTPGALAPHVLEVMEAFGRSAEEGRHIPIKTQPERPAPLAHDLVGGRLG